MLTIDQILSIKSDAEFDSAALEIFRFQADKCKPYREYISLLGINPGEVRSVEDIPFLPIELFKTHDIARHLPPLSSSFMAISSAGASMDSCPATLSVRARRWYIWSMS